MPTFEPEPIPLSRPPDFIRVVMYYPEEEGTDDELGGEEIPTEVETEDGPPSPFFRWLPNVVPIEIQHRAGAEPKVARFRYQFDPIAFGTEIFPYRVEHTLGLDRSGPYILRQDDRICVIRDTANGRYDILFDGYVQLPQADVSNDSESATFIALGVECREWDTPLEGAVYRQCPDPTVIEDVTTERRIRFNPDGKPNRTPDGAKSGEGTQTYHVFLDPELERTPPILKTWMIHDAAAYVIGTGCTGEYVQKVRSFPNLAQTLSMKTAKDGGFYDPTSANNVDVKPIPCHDLDVTAQTWPDALRDIIRPHGFDFHWRLNALESGRPTTLLEFFRMDSDGTTEPKYLYLQEPGSFIDPALSNVNQFGIARDVSRVANRIIVDTELVRYEASFVLAPLFTPAAGDVTSLDQFIEGNPAFVGDVIKKYRLFGFDETGDGHWDIATGTWVTEILSLDEVLGAGVDDPDTGERIPDYANRRRPPIADLFTKVGKEKVKAKLHISTDYNGTKPGVWDRTGTWAEVPSGWELLKDRLGIRVTAENPEMWKFTADRNSTVRPVAAGFIRLVSATNSTHGNVLIPRVYFRLTCVIEGDQTPGIVADRRPASVCRFPITRRVDQSDRFVKHVISKRSAMGDGKKDVDDKDNYLEADAYGKAMRSANENALFAGSATIPRITTAYLIGDRIKGVWGRGIDFRTNAGAGQGERAEYPVVVGVSWTFDGKQSTTLHLSDRRAEPAKEKTS